MHPAREEAPESRPTPNTYYSQSPLHPDQFHAHTSPFQSNKISNLHIHYFKAKFCNSQFAREEERDFPSHRMAEKVALSGGSMSVDLVHKGFDGPPVTIPKLGLGVYQVPPRDAVQATAHALQLGYRHIDSAALYRNEQAVGKAVRESGVPREQIFVTTKVWNSDQGYQNTLRAFERSLNELGLGYVDLYLVHSPIPSQRRLDTWKAMEEILRSGRAKAIGVSNYGVHHLKELFANCKIRPSVNQIQLHPFGTHEELVKFCEREGIVVEAYSPLTQGRRLKDRTLVQIAKEYNKSPAQILIRWCLQKNFVVLPKSVTPARILENSQVFDFNISEANMAKLDGLDEGWYCGWDPTLDR